MKILFTNRTLGTRTGTEIVTRDLAVALSRVGNQVCVFSPITGEIAAEIRGAGVPVVENLDSVPFLPDIIHGHHHVETALATVRFPTTPAIFVCHDRLSWHDSPPLSPAVRRFVAVDRNCLERLELENSIDPSRTRIVWNAVDLERFTRRGPLPERPKRALIFSNYATPGTHTAPIAQACAEAGVELSIAGSGSGASTDRPEALLGEFDIVFGKGRCALEAMAAGCAVILCDWQGLGGMVTSAVVSSLREWNFGMRCLQGPLRAAEILREITRYDPADADRVTDWIRGRCGLPIAVDSYLKIYDEALADGPEILTDAAARELELRVHHLGELETRLRAAHEPIGMAPLPESLGEQMTLRLTSVLGSLEPGAIAKISVAIENRSRETLANLPPNPVRVSYHWLDAESGECVEFDGIRTPLAEILRRDSVLRQEVAVQAPEKPGRYLLRVTLVQEGRFWFDQLPHPVMGQQEVAVYAPDRAGRGKVTLAEVANWFPVEVLRDGSFANLGFVSDARPSMLTFAEAPRFVTAVVRCPDAAGVITTAELADRFSSDIAVAVTDDPRGVFFALHNRLATETLFYGADFDTRIAPGARVHPRCWVDQKNVVIADGVRVGPNATITGRVRIDEGVVIHPGAVIGSAGFQTSDRFRTPLEMVHAGGVEIGPGCHIFANAVIARGLFRQNTILGPGCRVGNNAFVSHNCILDKHVFVGHGAVVNGNVRAGANAWIGPGATVVHDTSIGAGAQVSLGSTVIRGVPPGVRVTGFLALEHGRMLRTIATAGKRMNHE